MSYKVSELLMSSLEQMGIGDVAHGSLADHPTITLKLTDDNHNMNIIIQEYETWIWSVLVEFNQNALSFNSANLLPPMIITQNDYFNFGQPLLVEIDGNLEFRAQVKRVFRVGNFIQRNAGHLLYYLDELSGGDGLRHQ